MLDQISLKINKLFLYYNWFLWIHFIISQNNGFFYKNSLKIFNASIPWGVNNSPFSTLFYISFMDINSINSTSYGSGYKLATNPSKNV